MNSATLQFLGRVYIYSENALSPLDLAKLVQFAAARGKLVQFFGPAWQRQREELEHPLAFISHDSRDKDEIARSIALELARRIIPVWFSDFSLQVGDSLRESTERGLRECQRCVLVITPNFLSNPGWTKAEFNAIFTRELLEKSKLILPVWSKVSQRQVFDYSPTLADRFALSWEKGVQDVADRLAAAIRNVS